MNAKRVLVYTMTSGLGDYFVMGDLIRLAESMLPATRAVVMHRGNPHVHLWPEGDPSERFFDVYAVRQFCSLSMMLRTARSRGAKVFAMQMAPGSLQGFVLCKVLQRFGMVDYIVDFNLINADIITPTMGDYILDLHLNQLALLFQQELPPGRRRLQLPLIHERSPRIIPPTVGLHPWTRRKNDRLNWPLECWIKVAEYLLTQGMTPLLFGRDSQFVNFQKVFEQRLGKGRVLFRPSSSVQELVHTISGLSLLISLNSSVIHAAYALSLRTVVLSGPHLDFWTPKDDLIREVRDPEAIYPPSDELKSDPGMPMVSRIPVASVITAVQTLLAMQE